MHGVCGDKAVSDDGMRLLTGLAGAEATMTVVVETGIETLERSWEGPGPRFVHITARYQSRCGGCGSGVPIGTRVSYDRLERVAYHLSCAWVAIEHVPWLLPLFVGDAPPPGQVIAHPRYGWLSCVRLSGRAWADNGVAGGSIVGVAARRALPEEVELARWRAQAAIGNDLEWSWLDPDHVGDLAETVDEFTKWPLTRAAREPGHFVVRHPSGLEVFCQVAAADETERWLATDPEERTLYRRGYRWCRCYSVRSMAGEEGHVHLGAAVPMTRAQFEAANQRGWALG